MSEQQKKTEQAQQAQAKPHGNLVRVFHLKAGQREYQDVLDDDQPFLVTRFEMYPGDRVVLHESGGRQINYQCPRFTENCPYWADVEKPEHKGEETALKGCGQNRAHCYEYMDEQFTGRFCVLSVKRIFVLEKTREKTTYAFTFKVIREK